MKKDKGKKEKPVSLHPLGAEEALRALFSLKMEKPKKAKKPIKKSSKKE